MSKATLYTLQLVIRNFEEGLISPEKSISMEWFCEQMMRVIEDLERQQTDEYRKIKLVDLYRQYENLAKVFHAFSKTPKGEKRR